MDYVKGKSILGSGWRTEQDIWDTRNRKTANRKQQTAWCWWQKYVHGWRWAQMSWKLAGSLAGMERDDHGA